MLHDNSLKKIHLTISTRFYISIFTQRASSTGISQIDLRQKVCTPWRKYYITNQYIPYYSHFLIELLIQKTTKPLEIKRFALYQNHCSYLVENRGLEPLTSTLPA